MANFCVNLENGEAFIYERTLESDYLDGRFGAIPIIGGSSQKPQYIHNAMNIIEPRKLIEELRILANKLEKEL